MKLTSRGTSSTRSSAPSTERTRVSNPRPLLLPLVLDALLERHERGALEDLRAALIDRSLGLPGRCAAAILLLDQGDESGRPLLHEALRSRDLMAQNLSYRYLRWAGDAQLLILFVERTLSTAEPEDTEVAQRLREFLGPYLYDRRGLGALRTCLDHREPRVREFGARIAGLYRDSKAEAKLQQLLQDPSPRVRQMAKWALERLP